MRIPLDDPETAELLGLDEPLYSLDDFREQIRTLEQRIIRKDKFIRLAVGSCECFDNPTKDALFHALEI